jgi:hypothetical protein
MTAKQATIQQPLLSNGSANMHVSTATTGHSNNGRGVSYVVPAEIVQADP